jgi:acetyl-CoA synthetase
MRARIEVLRQLIRRSTGDIAWFWDAVVRDLDLEFFALRPGRGPVARHGVGHLVHRRHLNLAHNCMDRWARADAALAVIWEATRLTRGAVRRITAELREMADRLAHGLRSLGVRPGDAVGIFLPMAPETVAATLACAKIGAVTCFSGYAADAVATRLADADARCSSPPTGSPPGQGHPDEGGSRAAADAVPLVRRVIVWARSGRAGAPWNQARRPLGRAPGRATRALRDRAARQRAPLFIAYRPEHGPAEEVGARARQVPGEDPEEVAYQVDLHQDETLFWVTDLGWIMGPWEIVGAGAQSATVFLFDSARTTPRPTACGTWSSATASRRWVSRHLDPR